MACSCLFISYIGELCISPVVLSFITKLSVKYASLMMEFILRQQVLNKVAGIIGESK
jgi:dipeptide/tripeptide permease